MKIGDVVKYGNGWGVIYEMEGSYARLRIHGYPDIEPLLHSWVYIDLLEYDHTFLQHVKYKIYNFWEAITYDLENTILMILFILGIIALLWLIFGSILGWL